MQAGVRLVSVLCSGLQTSKAQVLAYIYILLFFLGGGAYGSFRKFGVPYFGALIIRIILFRVVGFAILRFRSPKA